MATKASGRRSTLRCVSTTPRHPKSGLSSGGARRRADQSREVRDCIAQGAQTVIETLPDPEGLREALAEARPAGLLVTSFNSGQAGLADVGSVHHVSVDEFGGGQEAGRPLNRHGVEGVVLCLIHEPANIALSERCNGLEDTYGGDVERFSVAESVTADLAGTGAAIAARLLDSKRPASGVFSLNAVVSLAASEAVVASVSKAVVATFDFTPDVLHSILAGDILFAISTKPHPQAQNIAANTLTALRGHLRFQERFGFDLDHVVEITALTMSTGVVTSDNAAAYITLFGRQSRPGQGGRP